MIERLRANPFPVLWAGLAVLIVPFLLMGRQVLAEKRLDYLPTRLRDFEDLVEPSLSEEEMVARARDHLRNAGLESDGYFYGVRLDFDQQAFEFLKKRHAGEIREFVRRGAPLVKWNVEFFRPRESVEKRERLLVTVDGVGRLLGLWESRYDPERLRALPSREDVEESRSRVARWIGVSPGSLQSTSRFGSGLDSADAVWSVSGLALGEVGVVVGSYRRGESLSFTEAIALPRGVRSMHSAGSRSALFVAVFLSIPLAFLMGFSARRVPAAPAAPLLRWSILIACGMAVLVSIVEAWFVRERNPWMSGLLLVWVLFVAILAMVTARRRLLPVPVQGHSFLRWVLVGAVPMAWAIVAIGCSVGFFEGCSHACTALRFTSAPLSILAVFLGLRDPRFYSFGLAVSAFALVPHCTCDNFGNHGWIAVVGASPMCALFGYATVLVSTAGLAGVLPRSCAGMLGVASTLVGSFAVGHHFLHFPW